MIISVDRQWPQGSLIFESIRELCPIAFKCYRKVMIIKRESKILSKMFCKAERSGNESFETPVMSRLSTSKFDMFTLLI